MNIYNFPIFFFITCTYVVATISFNSLSFITDIKKNNYFQDKVETNKI